MLFFSKMQEFTIFLHKKGRIALKLSAHIRSKFNEITSESSFGRLQLQHPYS